MITWRARDYLFEFPRPALIMGVVNVTPDSFSDGGSYFDSQAAVSHALRLAHEGADILDIGGESTRPKAAPVPIEEELRRVLPVLNALKGKTGLPLSIDTQKAEVASAALEAGAAIVNDIAANRADPEMWRIVAKFGAGYVLMHMQGTPQTMQTNPQYDDVVEVVGDFFAQRLCELDSFGVRADQIVLDVGIGFGKRPEHNLQLLGALDSLKRHGRPVLVGVSRKSFIGQITGAPEVAERLPGSLACACWAVHQGVQIIRTHDVAATRQAVRMIEAIQNSRND